MSGLFSSDALSAGVAEAARRARLRQGPWTSAGSLVPSGASPTRGTSRPTGPCRTRARRHGGPEPHRVRRRPCAPRPTVRPRRQPPWPRPNSGRAPAARVSQRDPGARPCRVLCQPQWGPGERAAGLASFCGIRAASTPCERGDGVARLLLLTSALQPSAEVLPALALLPHQVQDPARRGQRAARGARRRRCPRRRPPGARPRPRPVPADPHHRHRRARSLLVVTEGGLAVVAARLGHGRRAARTPAAPPSSRPGIRLAIGRLAAPARRPTTPSRT